MRAETFIAKRLYFADKGAAGHMSAVRPAVRVALAGIVVGVLVMLVTLCVVVGFKQTVAEKVAGFGAHIQVLNYESNNTYELRPIAINDTLMGRLRSIPNVQSVHAFCTKPGILKTDDAFQGIVLKGTDYWDYLSHNLVAGALPSAPMEALLSQEQSRLMNLHVGDAFVCYFVEENIRARKFTVTGIYQTGLKEYDELFIFTTPEPVRRLNGWRDNQVSGIDIIVSDLHRLDETADYVYFATANRLDSDGSALWTQTVQQQNPQIFAWLDLLDMNVIVIILLMLCVSGFNIVSGLIILILDGIALIGTLKALGAENRFVRRIFITEAAMLIGKGVLWGNVLGFALCAIQYFWHIVPLDAATYYVDYVPMAFPWGWIALMNIGTIFVSLLVLLAPSAIVARISPARVMHYE